MASTQKVTVTLPIDVVTAVRGLVAEGRAASVSGFVQHAVVVALDDVAGWQSMLHDALTSTGGELTEHERHWADHVLHPESHDGAA